MRLPGDADPSTLTLEAGRHTSILDAKQLHHVHFTGLTFRFTNVQWNYNTPGWVHPDLKAAVIRLNGSGDGIVIGNCTFEHVNTATRLLVGSTTDRIGHVSITDNVIHHTDHGAVQVSAKFENGTPEEYGFLGHVDLLRNNLYHIGWRIISGEHGHAVDLTFPQSSHLAGNFLHRIAGWGLSVTGGKPSVSSEAQPGPEIPFNRHLIHHNRVEDALVKSNDWGAIETWQGGPFYVFNNLVINPLGYKNWTLNRDDPKSIGSFGHAYYLDGSFKNYLFNNIAAGRNNTLATKSVNSTALQNIISFENAFFHNTFHKFAAMTRQQAPAAGRFRYLSNVMEDVSGVLFRHADPKDGRPDPNASHYTQGGKFAYNTLAYANNIIHNLRGDFGVFEETGYTYPDASGMVEALKKLNAQVGEVGVVSDRSSLRDPTNRDFRPAPDAVSINRGVTAFVPWALHGVVGEWNFVRNNANPSELIDSHWYMTPMYKQRENYYTMPRYPLTLVNGNDASHVAGALDTWAPASAVRLNGSDQHMVLSHERLAVNAAAITTKTHDLGFATLDLPDRLIIGREITATVRLKEEKPGQRIGLHVHWLKEGGWGGFNTLATGQPTPVQGAERAYTLKFKPEAKDGLKEFQILVFLSPDANYDTRTELGRATVARATEADTVDGAQSRTVDITTGNLLIETVLQTVDTDGVLVRKMDAAGYELALDGGKPRLTLRDQSGVEQVVTGSVTLTGDTWRHLIVEVDRKSDVRIYLDGKRLETSATGSMPGGSLGNKSDFHVGGAPGQPHLTGTLDFLRIARGSLADADTTIEELYAWQFDGPQFRDFAGNDRRAGTNAAGALVR